MSRFFPVNAAVGAKLSLYEGTLDPPTRHVSMILMPIIMVSPLAALLLFFFMPLRTAVEIYILVLIIAGYSYIVMFKSMRSNAKTGKEAMVGQKALVVERIDPEGKILFKDELWTATARGEKIPKDTWVRILGENGLVLIVEVLPEDKNGTKPLAS